MACRILYCHCAHAQVVPKEVKEKVLASLCESGAAFDAVADLCEMSARKDPALQQLAQQGDAKIVACYPRAVKWLFAAAHAPLAGSAVEVINMRTDSAEQVMAAIQAPLAPNLPVRDLPAPAPAAEPATAETA